MGILRRLRQWREKSDGTLSGPALETEDMSAASVETQSLSTGSQQIGNATAVTGGPIGDSGDYVWQGAVEYQVPDSGLTTTSTSFTKITDTTYNAVFRRGVNGVTNEDLYISLSALFNSEDGTTATLRFDGEAQSELSVTGFSVASGPRVSRAGESTSLEDLEMKVDTGTGVVKLVSIDVWGLVA